jgi:hypothetical protein
MSEEAKHSAGMALSPAPAGSGSRSNDSSTAAPAEDGMGASFSFLHTWPHEIHEIYTKKSLSIETVILAPLSN